MVSRETEMMSEREVETSTAQARQNGGAGGGENHPFSSLGRQSSIYSLTLDEFQHALCENGKNFGSMNMDEFLVSIWNAEENNNNNHQASAAASHPVPPSHNGVNKKPGIAKQPSLPRQGSLTLPAPLCRKTVEESGGGSGDGDNSNGRSTSSSNGQNNANNGGGESAARQPTFGEMTLEDFLVKAGVVREHPTNPKPMLNPTPTSVYTGIYPAATAFTACFQEAVILLSRDHLVMVKGQEEVGISRHHRFSQMGMVGPLSPVSSDGLGHGQVDNIGGQYGVDMGGLRGRKRVVDGPVEKVVERRQRRMIKNRESAARSRARKQEAYTVELEAELNQLKEENAQLKHALGELERKRKQQYFESLKTRAQPKVPKVSGRLRTLMRNPSCPL
ncbi:LOW QUALITY PROTEIN: hypothetical protein HID58_094600 [Brassica napus]|uniref:BZIP domain-containing protein n=1 Tax=Brassica napus TaxID=3708 RepID=A0ABQ7X6X4_BRANA|nr:LOW QUALITY PROTEIN: hypothetical protein HID58_094600 [Brassica napus]